MIHESTDGGTDTNSSDDYGDDALAEIRANRGAVERLAQRGDDLGADARLLLRYAFPGEASRWEYGLFTPSRAEAVAAARRVADALKTDREGK